MRILLLGAGGMLARALRTCVPGEHDLVARTRAELDVRDPSAVDAAMTDVKPMWIINAAAYTNVDGAEDDQGEAFAVNATAAGELARLCVMHRCAVVHYGTDYVFDGGKSGFYEEDDATHPLNVYGASKLAGEKLIRASGARFLVIRTQWLYGQGGRSFVGSLWDRAHSRTPTAAVSDEFGGCTYADDLARVSWTAVDLGLEGTYHAANRGRVSRYIIAQRIFAAFGVPELLSPARATDFPRRARRPVNSPLDVSRLEHALGTKMPEWTDAIDRYVRARAASPSSFR